MKSIVKCNNHETEEKRKETEIVVFSVSRRIVSHTTTEATIEIAILSKSILIVENNLNLDFLFIEQYHFRSTFCF